MIMLDADVNQTVEANEEDEEKFLIGKTLLNEVIREAMDKSKAQVLNELEPCLQRLTEEKDDAVKKNYELLEKYEALLDDGNASLEKNAQASSKFMQAIDFFKSEVAVLRLANEDVGERLKIMNDDNDFYRKILYTELESVIPSLRQEISKLRRALSARNHQYAELALKYQELAQEGDSFLQKIREQSQKFAESEPKRTTDELLEREKCLQQTIDDSSNEKESIQQLLKECVASQEEFESTNDELLEQEKFLQQTIDELYNEKENLQRLLKESFMPQKEKVKSAKKPNFFVDEDENKTTSSDAKPCKKYRIVSDTTKLNIDEIEPLLKAATKKGL